MNELISRAQAKRQSAVASMVLSRQRMRALLTRASRKPGNPNILHHYQAFINRYDYLLASIGVKNN